MLFPQMYVTIFLLLLYIPIVVMFIAVPGDDVFLLVSLIVVPASWLYMPYFVCFFIGLFTTFCWRKDLKKVKMSKKIKSVLMYPIYANLIFPISIISMFRLNMKFVNTPKQSNSTFKV
jgi:hypothetical protein